MARKLRGPGWGPSLHPVSLILQMRQWRPGRGDNVPIRHCMGQQPLGISAQDSASSPQESPFLPIPGFNLTLWGLFLSIQGTDPSDPIFKE